jgi:hypothetical protein
LIALVQDTPPNWLVPEPSSGLEANDQAVPFHDSMRVWFTDPLL